MNSTSLPALQAAAGEKLCLPSPPERSLEAVSDEMGKTANWKIILLILNGEHKVDPRSIRKVQLLAASKGITLFAIKYLRNGSIPASAYSDTEGINVLVSSLGGVTIPSSLDDLGQVMETIVDRTRQRYILSFPRPGNGTAGVHCLEVTSSVKGVRIVASATAAPLLDDASCISDPDTWLCSQQRPQYGPAEPPRK